VTGCLRNLHNEKVRDFHSSPSIIKMIKSRTIILVGNVVRMRARRYACRILVREPKERHH
jgi:hypothetical protein